MGRGLHYRIIVLGVALLMGGCGELTPPSERREEVGVREGGYHIVRPGDTLYSIAWSHGIDHRELAAWNDIPTPYLIHPGQRLSLTPPVEKRNPPSTTQSASRSTSKSVIPLPRTAPKASPKEKRQAKPRRANSPNKVWDDKKTRTSSLSGVENEASGIKNIPVTGVWRWPAEGKVIEKFDPDSGKKGIDITGRSGQSVFSAAAGDVVYSGSGLLGYGNLVIIKHDEIYLSAYGHNSQLLVKEGDKVATGQEIAKMGVSPKEGAMLHFEIRKEGKPVDPRSYLPKKN